MAVFDDLTGILHEVLPQQGESRQFSMSTPLLGAIPEFDSMTVLSLITSIEAFYGFLVDDEEISGEIFETVGSLVTFIEGKL